MEFEICKASMWPACQLHLNGGQILDLGVSQTELTPPVIFADESTAGMDKFSLPGAEDTLGLSSILPFIPFPTQALLAKSFETLSSSCPCTVPAVPGANVSSPWGVLVALE